MRFEQYKKPLLEQESMVIELLRATKVRKVNSLNKRQLKRIIRTLNPIIDEKELLNMSKVNMAFYVVELMIERGEVDQIGLDWRYSTKAEIQSIFSRYNVETIANKYTDAELAEMYSVYTNASLPDVSRISKAKLIRGEFNGTAEK